jgi:hypothetical protein
MSTSFQVNIRFHRMNLKCYQKWFGCSLRCALPRTAQFTQSDAKLPFLRVMMTKKRALG